MGDDRLILALDQGTTSSRAIAFGRDGRPVAVAQQSFEQRFPSPGHVTHDPEAIWSSQLAVAQQVVREVGGADRIAAVGITNQRETTIVWDRSTGAPIADAIVWQSRITAPACERLRAAGHEPLFRARTGLPLDAYFSGPKIAYILDAVPGARSRAESGELAFGTVDSFLLWRLTGGTARAGALHATDVSNASRTLLVDIHRLAWDDELLSLVGVPRPVLPEIRPTSGLLGETSPDLFGRPIPIAALAGDQQAATFGQACFRAGQAKNTYGTGAFLLLNTGESPRGSANGLLTTVGWQLAPGGPVTYVLEGSVFSAGSAVQWLRDGLKAIAAAPDIEALAASVEDTGGVYLVPAFTGLGAPYWDPTARGTIVGITRGTTGAHLASSRSRSRSRTSSRPWPRTPGSGWRRFASTAGRRRTTSCSSSRRTFSAYRSSGRSSPRRRRSARPTSPGWRSATGTGSTTSSGSGRSSADSSRRCRRTSVDRCCTAGIGRSNAHEAGSSPADQYEIEG